MLLGVFKSHNMKVFKKSATEYASDCPACGGDDRCQVWPFPDAARKRGPLGRYHCRQCGTSGDAINFLMEYDSMTYTQACEHLRITPRQNPGQAATYDTAPRRFTSLNSASPAQTWQEKALKLVDEAHAALLEHAQQLEWLARRGITMAAVKRFRLGYVAGEKGNKGRWRPRVSWGLDNLVKDGKEYKHLWIPRGLLIPYIQGGVALRLNIRRPDADYINEKKDKQGNPKNGAKYYAVPGGNMRPMMIPAPACASHPSCHSEERPSGRDVGIHAFNSSHTKAWVIVESELDAIMLASQLHGAHYQQLESATNEQAQTEIGRPPVASQLENSALPVGFIGLRTARVSNLEEHIYQALEQSLCILIALDFDQAGRSAWEAWPATFPQSRRWPVPAGKDPGEAFALGRDMREWIRLGLPPVLTLRVPAPGNGLHHAAPESKQPALAPPAPQPAPQPAGTVHGQKPKRGQSPQAPMPGSPHAGQPSPFCHAEERSDVSIHSLPSGAPIGVQAVLAIDAQIGRELARCLANARAFLAPHLAKLLASGWSQASLFARGSQPWPDGGWGAVFDSLWLRNDSTRQVLADGSIQHTWPGPDGKPLTHIQKPEHYRKENQ